MDGGADYRLRLLERAHDLVRRARRRDAASARAAVRSDRRRAGHDRRHADPQSSPSARARQADDAIWFSFKELCDGPRGQADYIEIARCYHTVFLTDVPVLGPDAENQARRFITLVDEFYDRAVKLIVSAAAPSRALSRLEAHVRVRAHQEPPDRDAIAGIPGATASAVMQRVRRARC